MTKKGLEIKKFDLKNKCFESGDRQKVQSEVYMQLKSFY